ncbi:unnamed protein product [Lepeophtheirus salmonis]|uniref:(salmon louse) hypothetical protein n=1 Tax=Lepeophtheirus salmonis TaxID=72036 RepID=A0A7R8H7A7_LEPSM|nr:unnamed protein product [Lepeophtheirus salmonis]CAF2898478.1 unnamed protein product [Lepeophtheirus salmonis]
MIIELDEFLDVNTNELANVFQEKNDSPVLVSLSIDHWLKHLNQKWTQAHISLIFGRFNSLKDFLKEIWDKSLCSNCQKYVFITDEDSLKLIIGERKIQDVFHLIIISMNEQRDEIYKIHRWELWNIKCNKNKQYNGIIGMAQRQEVDVSIGGVVQTYERFGFIDFFIFDFSN